MTLNAKKMILINDLLPKETFDSKAFGNDSISHRKGVFVKSSAEMFMFRGIWAFRVIDLACSQEDNKAFF